MARERALRSARARRCARPPPGSIAR